MTHPWCSDVSRDEAIRAAEDAVERPALPDWRELPERVAALEREVAAMLARVAQLEAAAKLAPDANVGEGSNHKDAEPVAWHVTADDPPPVGQMVLGRWDLLICGNRTVSYGEVVSTMPYPNVWWRAASRSERIPPTQWRPLPPGPKEGRASWEVEPAADRYPPPPRGWLTEEEREAVRLSALINPRLHDGKTAAALKGILARESPPKVRLPECPIIRDGNASQCRGSGWDMAVDAVRAALAAAGVEVEQ